MTTEKTFAEVIYDALTAELAEVCGVLNAANARLVELASRALETRAWIGEGIHSPAQWLSWQCGLSPHHGRALVEVAERIDELPTTFQSFRRGELSFDQWTPVARHAPGWADEQACGYAKVLTVSQLWHSMRSYPWPDDPLADGSGGADDSSNDAPVDQPDHSDGVERDAEAHAGGAGTGDDEDASEPDDAAVAHEPDTPDAAGAEQERFWLQPGDDGTWRFGGVLAGDRGELFNRGLSEARDRLFRDGQREVTWADALMELCNRSLDMVQSPSRRDRYRVHLHLQLPDPTSPVMATGDNGGDIDSLFPNEQEARYGRPRSGRTASARPSHGTSRSGTSPPGDTEWLAQLYGPLGHRLPDELRRYLTCDSTTVPVWERDGIPVSVGRSQHIVPDRTRHAVLRRDRGCRVPGCSNDRWLDVHHIVHWEHGGTTDLHNLVCLCAHHHRSHHRGLLGITGDANAPGGLTFTNRHGLPLQRHADPRPVDGPLPQPDGTYRHPIGKRVRSDDIYFNPPVAWRPHLIGTMPQPR